MNAMGIHAGHRSSKSLVTRFLRCEDGSAAVEYGVIIMAMFAAIIPAFIYVSTGMGAKFDELSNYFKTLS